MRNPSYDDEYYDAEPVAEEKKEAQESRALALHSPKIPVSLVELATLKGQALEIIQARVQVWEAARKAALRLTWPEDWLLFRDREGRVIGFLADAGCERVRGILGVSIFSVSKPEKITGTDPSDFYYTVMGSGHCALNDQTVENVEGGRSSKDDVCDGVTGAALDMLVRKSARANLDGGITRELAGLGSVPIEEIAAAWEGTGKKTDNCRKGRGFGSAAERMGADVQEASGVKSSEGPKCPKCGGPMRFKEGRKAEGKKKGYGAFWGCRKYPDCDGLVPHAEWEKQRSAQPPAAASSPQATEPGAPPPAANAAPAPEAPPEREPGADDEPPPLTDADIPFGAKRRG